MCLKMQDYKNILKIKKLISLKNEKTLFEKFFEKYEGVWDFSLDRIKKAILETKLKFIYQNKFTILILGSNGKGTTAYLLKSLILKCFPNLKVGLFTSPHLFSFKERFLINFNFFETSKIDKSFLELLPIIKKYKLTYFEATFLLALKLFKEAHIVIFEAGLGGRLDATNAISHNLYILTSISKEHTNILGNSLEKIAFEKLSAVRKNSTLILGEKDFYNLAKEFTDSIYVYEKDFYIKDNKFLDKKYNLTIKLNLEKDIFHNYKAIALALKAFFEIFKGKKVNISSIFINSQDYPPFRAQKLVFDNKIFLFDVSHNEESLYRLYSFLKGYRENNILNFFFTFMKDKEISIINKFLKTFKKSNFHFISIPYFRALKFSEFLNLIKKKQTLKKLSKNTYFVNNSVILKNLYPHQLSSFYLKNKINIFFGSFYLYNYLKLNKFLCLK